MYRIVYISDAVRPLTDEDLTRLLHDARTANAAEGVTGLLVFAQQSFLQVLEGETEAAVELAYARAAASRLHRNLRRSAVFVEPTRRFQDWSMGFAHAAPSSVVEALLQPLITAGHLTHGHVAGILLARFASLGELPSGNAGAVFAR